jgi:hypothetical protein
MKYDFAKLIYEAVAPTKEEIRDFGGLLIANGIEFKHEDNHFEIEVESEYRHIISIYKDYKQLYIISAGYIYFDTLEVDDGTIMFYGNKKIEYLVKLKEGNNELDKK